MHFRSLDIGGISTHLGAALTFEPQTWTVSARCRPPACHVLSMVLGNSGMGDSKSAARRAEAESPHLTRVCEMLGGKRV
jgi:hypothetical protein